MQTKTEKEKRNWRHWRWKDIFDEKFRKGVSEKLSGYRRIIGIAIFLGIFFHFFALGIVPSGSMLPTIKIKDMVFYVRTTDVDRGDVVYFKYPLDRSQMYVKRVIGIPGDEVEVKDGKVWVNGTALNEDYIFEKPLYTLPKQIVPEDRYFVLGDNRNNSEDSSQWGFLEFDDVQGKGIAIILPFQHIRPL